jgi:hypothetical protein
MESADVCFHDMVLQAINLGEVKTLEDISEAIDAVTPNDVLTVSYRAPR